MSSSSTAVAGPATYLMSPLGLATYLLSQPLGKKRSRHFVAAGAERAGLDELALLDHPLGGGVAVDMMRSICVWVT